MNKYDLWGEQWEVVDIQIVQPIMDKVGPVIDIWTTNAMNWVGANAQVLKQLVWDIGRKIPDVYEQEKERLRKQNNLSNKHNKTNGKKGLSGNNQGRSFNSPAGEGDNPLFPPAGHEGCLG